MWWIAVAASVTLGCAVFWRCVVALRAETRQLARSTERLRRVAVANDDVSARYARIAPHYRAIRPRVRRILRR